MNRSKLFILSSIIGISSLFGAGLPKNIDGDYGEKANCNMMPDLTIKKNYFSFSTVAGCEVKKVTNAGKNSFFIDFICSSEGEDTKQKSKLEILSNGINLDGTFYGSCSAPKENAASLKICKINEGQAGVTTFLDDKLKRQGSSVRDFDNYIFKASGTIKVGKTDALVGQLFLGDQLKEPKSYAYADEWECK